MSTVMRALVPAICAVASTAAAPPAAADVQLTADPTAAEVAVLGDTVLWSRSDATAGEGHLVAKVGGAPPADLPIDPFPGVERVDAGLGRSASGGLVAIYARCEDGDACDIHLYDFAAEREVRVGSVSSRRWNETAPSYDRGTIVFSRDDGPRAGLYVRRPRTRAVRIDRRVATSTAVSVAERSAAYTYTPSSGDWFVRRVRFTGRGGRTVARGGEGTDSYSYVARPSFTGGRVTYARHAEGLFEGNGVWLERESAAGGTETLDAPLVSSARARPYDGGADAATDGTTFVYAATDGVWRLETAPAFGVLPG